MKKIYHVMNQYNYYMSNIIFNIINIVLVIFLYNFGFFGEQTENIYEILLSFATFSFFIPISIACAIIVLITFITYLKNINENIKKDISIELVTYNIIFIPIIIALYFAMYYVWTTFIGSGWFCAFISIFASMFLFNYLYVMHFYKIIDRIFVH